MDILTKREARRFLLRKHGLLGAYRFSGKAGALAFLRQAGCVQFDPIDICGRSPDLTFHARVKGFTRRQLWELLYRDRKAVDYFDKNLSIIPVEDWPYFARERAAHLDSERSRERLRAVRPQILAEIARRGPLCAGDLEQHHHCPSGLRAPVFYWGVGDPPQKGEPQVLRPGRELHPAGPSRPAGSPPGGSRPPKVAGPAA